MKIENLSDKHKKLLIKDHNFINIPNDEIVYICSECNLHIIIKNNFYFIISQWCLYLSHLNHPNIWLSALSDAIYDLRNDKILKQRYDYLILGHDEKTIRDIIK